MKKVLLVSCNGLDNGGVQHVMMNIVRRLRKEFRFDMLLFTNDVRYFDDEFLQYGKIFRLPNYEGPCTFRRRLDRYIRFYRLYKGTKRILKENGPYDVIHCHNFFDAAPCLLAAKHAGVPVRISHSHNAFKRVHFIGECLRALQRKLINRAATCQVGCSQLAADFLFGKGKISIPNAIDTDRFNPAHYPQEKTKHSFIHVGRLVKEKNQSFVLDVFKQIQNRWQDATLTFVGNKDEDYEKMLRQKMGALQVKNVRFLPSDSDIPALLAQSEYMVFPSLFEGLPLTLLEAQAMRVKCFVSDAVTREADIGLCVFLPLEQSAGKWAENVFAAENAPVSKPQTDKVSLPHFIEQMRRLYTQQPLL